MKATKARSSGGSSRRSGKYSDRELIGANAMMTVRPVARANTVIVVRDWNSNFYTG